MKVRFFQKISLFVAAAAITVMIGTAIIPGNACHAAQRRVGIIKQIELEGNPPEIKLLFSGQPDYKVIQTDDKEIVIALKNVHFAKNLKKKGDGRPFINSVVFDKLRSNIAVLTVHTQRKIAKHTADWISSQSVLIIKLQGLHPKAKNKFSLKRKTRKTKRSRPKMIAAAAPPKPKPSKRSKSVSDQKPLVHQTIEKSLLSIPSSEAPYKSPKRIIPGTVTGKIDDLLPLSEMGQCTGHRGFEEALVFFKKQQWENAYDAFNQLLEMDTVSAPCLERAYFLRAYSHYKFGDVNNTEQFLTTENLLYDTINHFPKSTFIPFTLTALGKFYLKSGNTAEAEGFFNLIRHNYPDFAGYSEIIYELGKLQMEKENYEEAQAYFNEIITKYPDNPFATDAKIELAKTLYETNRFKDAIKLLSAIQEENPNEMFQSSDFLLHMGNAYYHAQEYAKAREFLEKAYNFFPAIESPDETLSRIGDTYVEQNQIEKAKKIFTLVTEKYPATNGFILSSIRLAENLDDIEEKKRIYQLIIDEYPENPMVKLAMLRMAKLYGDEGNYEESISTLKELLAERNRAIRRDANLLMEKTYRKLFESLITANDYPGILLRFEKDKLRITNFENPDILMLVGKAYLSGHLFQQAAEMFERAYDNFEKNRRPDELLYLYGNALQDAGNLEKGLEMLDTFVKKSKNSNYHQDAYLRMGKILILQKKYKESISYLTRALNLSQTPDTKVDVLMEAAKANHALKAYDTEVKQLQEVVSLLPNMTPETTETVFEAYQKLGEACTELKDLKAAAENFQKAITIAERFNQTTRNKAEHKKVDIIYFKLGETYERDQQKDEAAKVFKKLATSEDPFWARLAQEKLRGINIEVRHKANENV